MLLLTALAFALEPGAARADYVDACGCVEIQPGPHADKHNRTWRPLAEASHLEHLEIAGKPLLSAVMNDRSRVSLAERDEVPALAARIAGLVPLELRDQGSGYRCSHHPIEPSVPDGVRWWLASTGSTYIDSAGVGRALHTADGTLRSCLGEGETAWVDLKVAGSGKLAVKAVEASDPACVERALKGLRATVGQKAAGDQRWGLAR